MPSPRPNYAEGAEARGTPPVTAYPDRACKGVDTIFHNASVVHTKQNKQGVVWSVNLGGTQNLLGAARKQGVSRFIYVSSGSVVYEGKDKDAE